MVPGYPQDMFMVMDDMVAKPETHGLRPTWTGGMMGMMTLIRVLTPDEYDEIQRLKANWKGRPAAGKDENMDTMPGMEHEAPPQPPAQPPAHHHHPGMQMNDTPAAQPAQPSGQKPPAAE